VKKVVVGLTLVAVTDQIICILCRWIANTNVAGIISNIIFQVIVPVAVFVINVVVVIKVRRAAIHAAANLGVQPHHQSTSAVPTVMLITTSLIYVLLCAPTIILMLFYWWIPHIPTTRPAVSYEIWVAVWICSEITGILSRLVFAYNFYVYLITGKLFRSDLYKLFCRCLPSSSSSSGSFPPPPPPVAAAAIAADDAELARRIEADTAV